MSAKIICLAGGIGSGKSEVASRLADRLGCGVASFGNYVRSVAAQRGLADTRDALQQLGEELVASSLDEFCLATLSHGGWQPATTVVVDGVRHAEALECIRKLVSPSPALLIYLSVAADVRANRIRKSRSGEAERLAVLDQHSTEVQVKETLRDIADLVVDGTRQPDAVVQRAIDWLAGK